MNKLLLLIPVGFVILAVILFVTSNPEKYQVGPYCCEVHVKREGKSIVRCGDKLYSIPTDSLKTKCK